MVIIIGNAAIPQKTNDKLDHLTCLLPAIDCSLLDVFVALVPLKLPRCQILRRYQNSSTGTSVVDCSGPISSGGASFRANQSQSAKIRFVRQRKTTTLARTAHEYHQIYTQALAYQRRSRRPQANR